MHFSISAIDLNELFLRKSPKKDSHERSALRGDARVGDIDGGVPRRMGCGREAERVVESFLDIVARAEECVSPCLRDIRNNVNHACNGNLKIKC